MRRIIVIIIAFAAISPVWGQISPSQFELRAGYNLHNSYATRFNHLIESFNNSRYPVEISENLGSINFLRGFNFGVNYKFREDVILYAVFKNQHQFMEAKYVNYDLNRQFMFRQNTLELGVAFPIGEQDGFIRQSVSGGLVLGYMSIFTDWTAETKYQGSRNMFNISNSAVMGLAGSYEVKFHVSDQVSLYLKPVAMFNLPSFIRNLNEFMNPTVVDGYVTYSPGEPEKYNSGSLSGLGIEGGLLISLPELR